MGRLVDLAPAPSRTNPHANRPTRSRTLSGYCQVPRPGAAHVGLSDTRHASGWDVRRPRLHLVDTRPPEVAVAAARPDPLAFDPAAAGPAPDHLSVEARAMPQPLRQPPPSGVFYPPCLFGRFALQRPRWPLAHVASSTQMDAHRFDGGVMPGHLFQIGGQQPCRPDRTGYANTAWIQVDHPSQLVFPGGWHS